MRKTVSNRKGSKELAQGVRQSRWLTRLMVVAAGVFWTGSSWLAAETREIVGDPSLSAGPVHRALLGADYRDLWTKPIQIEVLDFSTEGGGLTPLFRVGGAQTFGLALKGEDGKAYTFRSLIKEQAQNLHESLRGFLFADIFQDQQASLHPAATVMVPPLASAVGVLHNTPRLVILPDTPALGEFRDLFKGRIGTIEDFPTKASEDYEGFHKAEDIIKSFELVPLWLASPETRVDAREHLRLRLFDMFLGDWDRHANNYRWAKLPGKPDWQPLPEDRDQAFVDFQGFLLALTRPFEPRLLQYEEDYPSSIGLTTQGWPIHRWFLAELDRPTWIEIANDMRSRLTDEVIDESVNLMPPEYYELSRDKLARIMRARRDKLPEIAERIYRYMSAELDVQATDENDLITLTNLGQGQLEVTVALKSGGAPYFQRTLNADDTKSLRVHMRGGQNTLVCKDLSRGGIKIDVVGSRNNDKLQGCSKSSIRFTETDEIERRKTALRVSPNPFEKVGLPSENIPPESDRPRDWRNSTVPNYIIRVGSDDGLVLGGGFTFDRFEFGKNPFGQSHTLTGGVSLTRGTFEAGYSGTYQLWDPRIRTTFDANITSIDEADFFGFGNDTSDSGDSDLFDTEQTRTTIRPGFDFVVSPELNFFSNAEFNFNATDDDDDTLLNDLAPLGVGDFGWLNLIAGIDYDTRDRTVASSPGYHVRVQGSFSPTVFDVDSSFTSVEGEAAGFFGLGTRALLALRVGGRNVSGDFPFQEAAYIGGRTTVRGLDTDRFAGDASVFGSAEIRYTIGEASAYVARAEYGVFAFADVGRVFVDDEDEDDLHPSAGVGISASALDRTVLLSFAIAASEERVTGLFTGGFSF